MTVPGPVQWTLEFASQRDALLRHCRRLVGPDEAEDMLHETYLAAVLHADQIQRPRAVRAWLFRVATNRCLDLHRRRRRLVALGDRDPAGHPARDLGLRHEIEQLPPRARTIVVLYYAHGFGLREVADMLGLSHTNTRSILFRSRARLRETLGESSNEVDAA